MIAYLGLGSNLGDRQAAIDAACQRIAAVHGIGVHRRSGLYDTPPMGPQDQGRYLNAVLEIDTTLAPAALLDALQTIERDLGREPRRARRHWGPRVIDLDILLLAERIITEPGLKIPHPRMAERWFVLKPLAELAPNLTHPATGQTIAQMLANLETLAPADRGSKIA